MKPRIASALLTALDSAALVALRPHPTRLLHNLAGAGPWLARQPDAALAQLAGAALWLVAAWLGLGLLAALLAHLPGVAGAAGRRVAAVALPRVLHRVVIGSLGVGIVLTPVAASAASAPGAPAATAVGAVGAAVPSPVWPTSPPQTTPAPRWPVSPPAARPAPVRPAPRATRPTGPAPATRAGAGVQVRPGDTLWQLAADRLGPMPRPHQVSHYWQRIYAANRPVIGGDPDRIHPGQQLVLPAPTAEELP